MLTLEQIDQKITEAKAKLKTLKMFRRLKLKEQELQDQIR